MSNSTWFFDCQISLHRRKYTWLYWLFTLIELSTISCENFCVCFYERYWYVAVLFHAFFFLMKGMLAFRMICRIFPPQFSGRFYLEFGIMLTLRGKIYHWSHLRLRGMHVWMCMHKYIWLKLQIFMKDIGAFWFFHRFVASWLFKEFVLFCIVNFIT